MEPWMLALFCLLFAVALVAIDLFVPSGGVLAIAAGVIGLVGVAFLFVHNSWLGLGVLTAIVLLAPFVFSGMVTAWQKSPIGKRVMLTAITPPVEQERVRVGMTGRTVSTLRPMGEAEFGMLTVQVISEFGTIDRGKPVHVVSLTPDGIARVRLVSESA
jgi:membrane-bound ClpP family serine protease